MMRDSLANFLSGADALGFVIASLLLLRAWRRTRDFLFAAFSAAFALLAIDQLTVTLEHSPSGEPAWTFLPRLAAFTFPIAAIVHKNLGARRPPT